MSEPSAVADGLRRLIRSRLKTLNENKDYVYSVIFVYFVGKIE